MIRLLILSFAVIALSGYSTVAQEFHSVHKNENERHSVLFRTPAPDVVGRLSPGVNIRAVEEKGLTKRIFGWYPYWMQSAYTALDYSLLSTIAYFSYEVDTATGSYRNIRQWKTTDLIPFAHERGTTVLLTVTNFGNENNAAVLRSTTKRRTLIDSLMVLVGLRNADGVNIDFEGITDVTLRDSLTAFIRDLAMVFHSGFRPLDVTMAIPAVDWNGIFDIRELDKWLDYYIVMTYDYHWQTGPEAGPVSPLDSSPLWGAYSTLRSVRTYRAAGASERKLLLGAPYYGYEWSVTKDTLPAKTVGAGSSMQYYQAIQRAADNGRIWDAASSTPYYKYTGGLRQGWYEDGESLGIKYDSVLSYQLGGIGIWALGYDGERPELWDLLRQKFALPTAVAEHENKWQITIVSGEGRISVICRLDAPSNVSAEVYDLLGRTMVSQDRGMQSAGRIALEIPVDGMRGTYFVKVRIGERSVVRTIVL